MHQQRIMYVDPESELLLVRHPPQINSLQPVQNQPETPMCNSTHHVTVLNKVN
jgi:hypothetical protein